MSKSERKTSIISGRRRKSSNKKSLTSTTLSVQVDSSSLIKTIQEEPSSSIQIEKPKINYQDEVVLIFFNSMLEVIVDDWKSLQENFLCDCKDVLKGSSTLTLPSEYSFLTERGSLLENLSQQSKRSTLPSVVSSQGLFRKKKWSKLSEKSRASKRDSASQKSRKSTKVSSRNTSLEMKREVSKSPRLSSLRSKSRDESTSLAQSSHSLDWMLDCSDEIVTIRFKNGNYYEGQVSRKVMNGYGRFIWSDGSIYVGDFCRGSASGKGVLQLPDLSTYEGDFCKNRLHGEGVFKPKSTEMIYSGQWKSSLKHGEGWMSYEAGNSYTGEWANDHRHGRGAYSYKTGEKYSGAWHEGHRHGFGVATWPNNDFFKGSWAHGHMQGHGEYTWNTFLNKSFTYPIQNCYWGNWANSMRHGVGIMNFGTDGGAQLAGLWKNNKKQGPGVMICDNGFVLEKNPLFCCDKPINLNDDGHAANKNPTVPSAVDVSFALSMLSLTSSTPHLKSNFRLISHQLSFEQESDELTESVLHRLNQNMERFGWKCFHDENNVGPECNRCNPLWIPLHAPPEQQDFFHYINLGLQKYFDKLYRTDWLRISEQNKEQTNAGRSRQEGYASSSKYSKWNISHMEGSNIPRHDQLSLNSTDIEIRLMSYQTIQLNVEKKYIKNAIIMFLPKFQSLYHKYCTIATSEVITFKTLLVRLFLWQMIRDLKIQELANCSLVELDKILMENDNCGLETLHGPFEKIYFWQFLNIILTFAWITHSPAIITNECKIYGIMATILRHFVTEVMEKNVRITYGCSLFAYKDLVPINNVYSLYTKLGECMTAREFLNKVCVKKGHNPPCYLRAFDDEPIVQHASGTNVVAVAGYLTYLPDDLPGIGEIPSEPYPEFKQEDPFRKQLYALRAVGPKRFVECLTSVCPKIKEDGVIVNMDYQLSFIEFYDILLMCTFIAVDVAKKREKFQIWLEERRLSEELKLLQQSTSKLAVESSRLSRLKEKRRSKLEI